MATKRSSLNGRGGSHEMLRIDSKVGH